MLKTKLFITTYNNPQLLHENIKSLIASNFLNPPYREIYIINNHSNFVLDQSFQPNIRVIHNQGRPDFSTGHLARNWNQALLHGFKDLSNPISDIVIHVQDDTTYRKDFWLDLEQLHTKYNFITDGLGD